VVEVRNWLKVATRMRLPSGNSIWDRYSFFWEDLESIFQHMRYSQLDVQVLEVVEYIEMIRDWQARRPAPPID
jgi:oligoribonuclease (3'-5' exoribonuclease)